jgi:hypothetical protein
MPNQMPNQMPNNSPSNTWQDAFGNAIAVFEGRVGGPTVLVLAPSSLGMATLEAMRGFEHNHGRLILAVMPAMHTAPTLALLRATAPRLILEIGEIDTVALAGKASIGLPEQQTAPTGLVYQEANNAPAWSALGWGERLAGFSAVAGPPSLVLGAASSVGAAAVMVNLALLRDVLQAI